MSLHLKLKSAKSEEDVKDAYIKALGLRGYTKGLIDIQTDDIWFEAKDTGKHSSYAMFTQLLHYVQVAMDKGEQVPPLLAVIDTEKAALMKSTDVLLFWLRKPSSGASRPASTRKRRWTKYRPTSARTSCRSSFLRMKTS